MKNMKGFTLVELLAVIVILAIVALVTAPAILNVINDSRQKGAEDKAWGTIDAVRLAYSQAQTDGYIGENSSGVTYDSSSNTITVDFSNTNLKFGDRSITLSGDKPKEGTVTMNISSGVITCKNLKFAGNGTYYCNTNNGTEMNCDTSKSS